MLSSWMQASFGHFGVERNDECIKNGLSGILDSLPGKFCILLDIIAFSACTEIVYGEYMGGVTQKGP